MTLIRSRQASLKRLGFHTGVFASIYLVVFMIMLWAGARIFSSPDAFSNEGVARYLDEIASVIVYTLFTPFHFLGYEFIKLFGPALWYAVAAFWSALLFLPYLTICFMRKKNEAASARTSWKSAAPDTDQWPLT